MARRSRGGPFEQAPLSYRERKAAERRAAARAAARAEAMPPPDPTTRVTVSGTHEIEETVTADVAARLGARKSLRDVVAAPKPLPQQPDPTPQLTPDATPLAVAPTLPTAAPAAPLPGAVPNIASGQGWASSGQPGLSVTGVPTLPGQPLQPVQPGPGYPLTDQLPHARPLPDQPGAPNVFAVLRAPWTGRWAKLGLLTGAAAVVGGFVAALGWGAAVLDHPMDLPLLGWGLGVLVAGAAVASRGWQHSPARLRRSAAGIVLLLTSAFAVGVATNPVVVDGRVFLATSQEARQYQMMRQIHTDLLRLRQLDVYLTYSPADAGAHYDEYAPALKELTDMSNTYAGYTTADLPDKRFAETVANVKSAAYWAAKAMRSKIELLEQEDARYADNVATFRANFAQQYLAAGRALQFLSADLNIPVDTREHE